MCVCMCVCVCAMGIFGGSYWLVEAGSRAHMGLCHLELVLQGSTQTEEALCSLGAARVRRKQWTGKTLMNRPKASQLKIFNKKNDVCQMFLCFKMSLQTRPLFYFPVQYPALFLARHQINQC